MLCMFGTIVTGGYGGMGFGLSQATSAPSPGPFPATGSGITYAVTSVPATGLRIDIDRGTSQYCAVVTKASDTVPWASLVLDCYGPVPGEALAGPPPDATQIEFQLVGAGTADFCVTKVSFAP
jgi:hypothetical protein